MTPAAVLSILVKTQGVGAAQAQLSKLDGSARRAGAGIKKTNDHAAKSKRAFALTTSAVYGAAGAIGGLVVVGGVLVKQYEESRKVGKQTNAVLKSTGGVAKVSAKHVSDLATAISEKSGVDDEAIQSGENLLLTFTNIRNEVGKGNKIFDQATQITTDMSAALGQDMKSSAIQVGKALNDPIKGVTALQRVGVSFTAAQKDQIKTLESTGHHLGAQKLILKELKNEFGGSAAAVATPFDKLKVTLGNLQESVGGVLAPMLEKGATALNKFIIQAQNGTGAGGRFVDKVKDIWNAVKPTLGTLTDLAGAVYEFAKRHPIVTKLAGAMLAVGSAIKLIKFGSRISGLSTFLGAAATGAKAFKRIWSGAGTDAAAAASANAGSGLKAKLPAAISATKSGIVKAFATLGAAGGAAMSIAAAAALPALVALVLNRIGDAVKHALDPKGNSDSAIGGAGGDKNNALDLLKRLIPGFAVGGPIHGGTPGRDSVPAMLMPGEHVLTAREVKNAGGHGAIFAMRRSLGGGGQGGEPVASAAKRVGPIESLARRVWGAETDLMRSHGPMPNLIYGNAGRGNDAFFNAQTGSVTIDKKRTLAALRNPNSANYNYALSTLVHEFAHARQRADVMYGPKWELEGGAETFAQWADNRIYRRLGVPFKDPAGAYDLFVHDVKTSKSAKWWQHDQFARDTRGFAKGGAVGPRAHAAGAYGYAQLERLWRQAGGSAGSQAMAAAIALAESGGNPTAAGTNTDGSIDRGLWQINSVHGAQSTFDVMGNARAAVSISSGGRNWSPWVVYQTGAYRRYLQGGVPAAAAVPGSSGAAAVTSAPVKRMVKKGAGSGLSSKQSAAIFAASGGTTKHTIGAYKGKQGTIRSLNAARAVTAAAGVDNNYLLSTLTPGNVDDLATAQAALDFYNTRVAQYAYGLKHGDSRVTGEMLQGAISSRDTYQGYINDITKPADGADGGISQAERDATQAEIRDLLKAMDTRAKAVTGTVDGTFTQWATEMISGRMGTTAAMTGQVPSTPGVTARL